MAHAGATPYQERIICALWTRGIPYDYHHTGGGCTAIVVSSPTEPIEVVATNMDPGHVVLDGRWGAQQGDYLFSRPDTPARYAYFTDRDDETAVNEYVAIASYLRELGDPDEWRLADGTLVADELGF